MYNLGSQYDTFCDQNFRSINSVLKLGGQPFQFKGFVRNQQAARSAAVYIRRPDPESSIAEATVVAKANNELTKRNYKFFIKFIDNQRIGIAAASNEKSCQGLVARLMDCNALFKIETTSICPALRHQVTFNWKTAECAELLEKHFTKICNSVKIINE